MSRITTSEVNGKDTKLLWDNKNKKWKHHTKRYHHSITENTSRPTGGTIFTGLASALGGVLAGGFSFFLGLYLIMLLNRASLGLPFVGFRSFLSIFDGDTSNWFSDLMNSGTNAIQDFKNNFVADTGIAGLDAFLNFFAGFIKFLVSGTQLGMQVFGFVADVIDTTFTFLSSLTSFLNFPADPLNDMRDANWQSWASYDPNWASVNW